MCHFLAVSYWINCFSSTDSVFSYITGTALNILWYAFHFFIYICNDINQVFICASKNLTSIILWWASLVVQLVKNLPAMQKNWVWSLGWEDTLEKEMAAPLHILAWRIPWTEKPGRLESIGSPSVRHSLATKPPLFFDEASQVALVVNNLSANAGKMMVWSPCHGEGHGNPLQYSCL